MFAARRFDEFSRTAIFGLFLGLLPACLLAEVKQLASQEVGARLPPMVVGRWQVAKTHIDLGYSGTRHYQYDDPALTGRFLTIDYDKISYDLTLDGGCSGPLITKKRLTAATLLQTMGWHDVPPVAPTPKDYELPVDGDASLEVFWVACKAGDLGPVGTGGIGDTNPKVNVGPENANWIAILPNGHLAMRWLDNTIVTLVRVPPNAKPEPSFDCAKASNSAEKTICASIDLASYDRSLSRMYKTDIQELTKEGEDDALQWVRTSQKEWLIRRNSCGSDLACLKKSMMDRLEALSHPNEK